MKPVTKDMTLKEYWTEEPGSVPLTSMRYELGYCDAPFERGMTLHERRVGCVNWCPQVTYDDENGFRPYETPSDDGSGIEAVD